MRDIPVFSTGFGVASLTLSQIPYTQQAYIRVQASCEPELFLRECYDFCRAAGGEKVYATGHPVCQKFPEHTAIIEMRAAIDAVGDTDAALFPVTQDTLEQWRTIYNEKIRNVPNGAWKSLLDGQSLLQAGDGYFVHRNGELLGIGKASGDRIHWVASVKQGAGADIVRALCHALNGETVHLEVASSNVKAVKLYERLGFIGACVLSVWHSVIY